MARTVNREPIGGGRDEQVTVKREHVAANRADPDGGAAEGREQRTTEKRAIRSRYLALMNTIREERDDLVSVDSDKFNSIFKEVENLHKNVQKPREQVVDAEALFDLADTLRTSVKSQSNEGITPADFISGLLKGFGQSRLGSMTENERVRVQWKDIGLSVSPIFRKCPGCCTMLGPMDTQIKQRKTIVQRKRTKPTEKSQPEEVDEAGAEEKTDTDKNMVTMFDILRKKRVKLECLILNRNSFAQTVENLFALSFLVKDGRAEIVVDNSGAHFVKPKNAPAANQVMSGEVSYDHFVFRLDFADWKLMKEVVSVGDELMPHRLPSNNQSSREGPVFDRSEPLPTTPIRKLSRNRGLVIQDESIVEDSPEIGGDDDDDDDTQANAIRKCKRKLR